MQNLIVPVDGSETSWRAVDAALALARRNDARVDVLEIVFAPRDVASALARMNDELGRRDTAGLTIEVHAEAIDGTPVAGIAQFLDDRPEATVVMASHGRGRSAALLGSVTEDLLQRAFGPVLVIGPHVDTPTFDGPVVVPVDGTEESEAAIPLAVAWAIELGVAPWIVHMSDPTGRSTDMVSGDVMDTAYVARLAHGVANTTGHRVEFDELHGTDPIEAVAEYAAGLGAGLIVATTHARTGWSRLTSGSVSSGFVRDAACPVLEHRLPRPGRPDGATGSTRHVASG